MDEKTAERGDGDGKSEQHVLNGSGDGNQNQSATLELCEYPFTATVLTHRLPTTCSYCFAVAAQSIASPIRLLRCSKCKFVYYCNDECQKKDWSHHKRECQRVRRFHALMDEKGAVRKIPPGFIKVAKEGAMWQFPDEALRLVARLMDLWDRSETKSYTVAGRTLAALETHEEDVQANKTAMEQFRKFSGMYEFFCTGDGTNGRPEYDKAKLMKMYSLCRSNAFCMKDVKMESVGCGIYVNLRRLQHSCTPNARIVFQGREASVAIFVDPNENGELVKPNVTSYDKIRCSYTDCMVQRSERRQKLKEVHFFDCHCELCENDQWRNDAMEGLLCDNADGCDGIVVWQSKDNDDDDGEYKCRLCGKKYDDQENAKSILQLTREILDSPQTRQRAIEEPQWAKEVYANLACMQMPTFHPYNVYRIRTMKESYETACRLGNWADAASYGKETLDGYKKYMNQHSDPEYAIVEFNVAKALINDKWNVKEALPLAQKCKRCFEYAFGSDSEQSREVDKLVSWCESYLANGGLVVPNPEVTVMQLRSMLDKAFRNMDV